MAHSIFSHSSYKPYLHEVLKTSPRSGHGVRQQMAAAMGIQPTYLSQVLKGDRDLSYDQGVLLADFLHLSREEAEFFLLLIQKSRAGNVASRQFIERQISERRDAFVNVKKRVQISDELSDQDKAVYYSDALYGAVHMAVLIAQYRTTRSLAARLRVPEARIREVTGFLLEKGLITKSADQLLPSNTLLFVDKKSPYVVQHHRNWRLKAMERIAERNADDYNISLGITLSVEDARLIRQQIAKFIEETAKRVKDSPSEKLMGLCIDFFDY